MIPAVSIVRFPEYSTSAPPVVIMGHYLTHDAMTNVKLASNGLLINNLPKPEKSYE